MKWIAAVVIIGICGYIAYVLLEDRQVEPVSSTITGEGSTKRSKPPLGSRQYTVLLDSSVSRPEHMIHEGQRFIDLLVDQMNYGDRLIVLQMYEAGVNDVKSQLDFTINKSNDVTSLEEQERLAGARKGVKDALALFFQNALKKPVIHTDILTTLSIASEEMSPKGHNCLILLSDMLQSSKELEFEHLRRMPSSDWVDKQSQEGLVRPLRGSSVVVVGADPSTHEGVVVRDFWKRYFSEANALLDSQNYRTTPPSDASACD
jgi:hypothetical protein